MMSVFFVSNMYNITCRNIASILNFVVGFRWQSEYP
ncbi:hypothetical protein FWK35_00006284 [Aphis craccivora]|uniref:Uncharacterized protein n=1 Tax=Aphis craccivora TaxID=307492 RepID=A0A6G0ZBA8_APHCR|nr:hypothetical protein FWK35_00006284 [Aphis craccivora]